MLQVTELAFACYAVTDNARARAFFQEVLGAACGWNSGSRELTAAQELDDFSAAIAQKLVLAFRTALPI